MNNSDTFRDATNIKPTKRKIFAIISSAYDLVGYLQHCEKCRNFT